MTLPQTQSQAQRPQRCGPSSRRIRMRAPIARWELETGNWKLKTGARSELSGNVKTKDSGNELDAVKWQSSNGMQLNLRVMCIKCIQAKKVLNYGLPERPRESERRQERAREWDSSETWYRLAGCNCIICLHATANKTGQLRTQLVAVVDFVIVVACNKISTASELCCRRRERESTTHLKPKSFHSPDVFLLPVSFRWATAS